MLKTHFSVDIVWARFGIRLRQGVAAPIVALGVGAGGLERAGGAFRFGAFAESFAVMFEQ